MVSVEMLSRVKASVVVRGMFSRIRASVVVHKVVCNAIIVVIPIYVRSVTWVLIIQVLLSAGLVDMYISQGLAGGYNRYKG